MTTLTKRQARMLTQAAQPGAAEAKRAELTHQYIPLDDVRTDGGTQARAGLHEETVADYAATWSELARTQNGFDQMPPIVVFYDGESYWLADGFHRLAAYRRFLEQDSLTAAAKGLFARVEQGTRRDAVLYAAGANADHGLRRTTADKERAVLALLRDEEWSQWSDREIARRCKVSHDFVRNVTERHGLTGRASSERKTADGRTMNVSGIATANKDRAQPTDDQVAQMRERFRTLGYEQFYVSDAGWTAYHPKKGRANYKTWADVERDIARKEGAASMRCERCGKHWGAPGSMVTSEGRLCPDCAATRLSSGEPIKSVESEAQIRRCGRCKKPHRNMTGYGEGVISEYPNGITLCHPCIVELIQIHKQQAEAATTITTAPAPDEAAIPHLPPPAEWKVATQRATAIGLRLDMTAQGAFCLHRLSDQGAAGGAVDWPAALDLLTRKEVAHFRTLIEQAESLGATINPAAYDDAAYVQVIPPKGYQQAPLKCDASDLAKLVAAWMPEATWEAPTTSRSDWWNCGREWKAVETAINAGDQLRAVRAAAALTIALGGGVSGLALGEVEHIVNLAVMSGYTRGASAIRTVLLPESEATP